MWTDELNFSDGSPFLRWFKRKQCSAHKLRSSSRIDNNAENLVTRCRLLDNIITHLGPIWRRFSISRECACACSNALLIEFPGALNWNEQLQSEMLLTSGLCCFQVCFLGCSTLTQRHRSHRGTRLFTTWMEMKWSTALYSCRAGRVQGWGCCYWIATLLGRYRHERRGRRWIPGGERCDEREVLI